MLLAISLVRDSWGNKVAVGRNGNSSLEYISWLKNRKDGVQKLVVVRVGGEFGPGSPMGSGAVVLITGLGRSGKVQRSSVA